LDRQSKYYGEYNNVQKLVKEYKNARTTRQRNTAILGLKKVFSQHYKVILSLTTDYVYTGNYKIKSMILGQLPRPKNMSYTKLHNVIKGIFAGYTFEEIESIVDEILINLLNSYVREDLPFFRYFTWYLPKRFGTLYISMSKNSLNQFYNVKIDEYDEPEEYYVEEVFSDNTFLVHILDKHDYEILMSYLEDEHKYNKVGNDTKDFEVERVKNVVYNVCNFVKNNKEFIQENTFDYTI